MMRWQTSGFGLYVHWPFCQSKCPYCDFNSHVASAVNQDEWQRAYLSEIDRMADELSGRTLRSIFFGGGTPSLMPPALVAAIIERATTRWTPANDIEITLEANPTSVEISRFKGFRAAGVNRVSVGIQALNDDDLKRLGRMHDVNMALKSIEIAHNTFDRVSFDLIYARQNQTLKAWESELSFALSLATSHLSLYQLTIEDGTVFSARHKAGLLHGLPHEDLSADLYLTTQELCGAAGLPAYEVSNHAKPGFESQHNLIYWKNGDYAGIGPGAHGRLTFSSQRRVATTCEYMPDAWLTKVNQTGSGEIMRDMLSLSSWAEEYVLMGIRLASGLSETEYRTVFGKEFDAQTLNELTDAGLLIRSHESIRATPQGRLLLNKVIEALLC